MPASRIFPILCAAFAFATLAVVALTSACGGGDDGEEPGADALPIVATFFGAEEGDSAAALASGDFNGDGEMDVALGAGFADGPDNERPDAGEVYIFLGPFAEGDELDAAEGDQLLTIFGAAAGDNLGRALVAADFDADGVDELGIGAPGVNRLTGSVYAIFSVATRPEGKQLDLAQSPLGVVEMLGEDEGDYAGLSLAADDLDELPGSDLLAGALLADGPENTRTDAGAVYLVTGPRSGAPAGISLADAVMVHGAGAGDHLGETVATGDVTGDGNNDALLAAPFADAPNDERTDAGETYILSAFDESLDLAVNVPIATIIGIDPGDQLGHSLTAIAAGVGPPGIWLGAVSADGRDNSMGLAGEGVYVIVGTDAAEAIDARDEADAIVYGEEDEARLGRGAASFDMNADGLGDLLMTASDVGELNGQLIAVLTPAQSGTGEITPGRAFTGLNAGDYLGTNAFGGPPVVAPEPGLVLISAPHGDGPDESRTDCGEAYLLDLSGD